MIAAMRYRLKIGSLLFLAATALVLSGAVFAAFRDPEGPNLVVIVALAAVLYLLCLAFYLSKLAPRLAGAGRIVVAIVFQVLLAAGAYLGMR